MSRRWTKQEDEVLRTHYGKIPLEELAATLDRKESAVKDRWSLIHSGQQPIIEFDCSYCGKHVVTEGYRGLGRPDRRTRFCCAICEKKYWRRPPHEHKSARQTFQSLQLLKSYEERTNRI